ncbi:MAG: tetratricopeptide repeat protein [Candidatus Gastranaerophilales bacterium]|nr:tetratricopeptide repeat protein [Candidatus Gastranaerophilales bacterium]
MQFKKILRLGVFLFLSLSLFLSAHGVEKINEIDTIRAELSFIRDKNSPDYIKAKQKLDKIIKKQKIDYSNQARFVDVHRLISEQKYNSAVYELNDLIELGFEISKCNELLGDISYRMQNSSKKTAQYFKLAIKYDSENTEALYKLAKLYLIEKKNILAIEYLKQTIESTNEYNFLHEIKDLILNNITPQNKYEANNLYEALASAYFKLGYKNKCYNALSKAIQINPKDIYLKYHLSGMLFDDNENDYAMALLDSILSENPSDSQIKNLKAKILLKKGYAIDAYEQYLEILSEFPYSKQAKYGIYKIYKNKLKPNEILKKVYSFDASYSPSIKEIYAFSELLYEMNDVNGAQNFEKYAKHLEEMEQEKNRLALAQQEKEKKEKELQLNQEKQQQVKNEKAELLAKKIVPTTKKEEKSKQLVKKNAPKKDKAENKISKKEPVKETPKKETKNVEKIKQIKKTPVIKTKKYLELNEVAKKYLSMEPKTAQNYLAAANTYRQMNEQEIALKYYKEAMKLDPTNSDIYYNIGLVELELNCATEAKINLEKAINLDTENSKAKNLLAFVNQKIITEAINSAYNYYENKDYITAFEIIDSELKNYPKNAQLYYYRGLICSAMDRNAASIIDFQKAIEIDASYYMAYYQLGKTYEKISDERSALVAYEQFLSIEPDEKELVDEIQKKVISLGAKYY